MTTATLEKIHKEIHDLKKDMDFIKHVISEEYGLSEWAKNELLKARKVADSELIDHEEIKKRILI